MTHQRGIYDTSKVGRELTNWLTVKEFLASEELDEETLFDTIDGETELIEVLCAIKESALEDKAALTGLDGYLDDLKARKSRLEKTIKTKDAIILSTMERADINRIKGPLFTMSKGATAPKVIITEESDIPTRFFKVPDPVVDKTALKKALEDPEDKKTITGAELSNGGISLRTRIV